MPDCGKLAGVQRRHTFCGFIEKGLIGLFAVTIFLDDATGKAGHRSIAAALRDDQRCCMAVRHIRIEIILLQKFRQVHAARIQSDLGSSCSKEETCSIQRLRIKKRKDGIDQLFGVAV